MYKSLLFITSGIISMLFISACSPLKPLMVSSALPLIADQRLAVMRESDFFIAQSSMPSNIKIIEGLLLSDPSNSNLKLWACEALSGYAVGFVEDNDSMRASTLYLRAREHAIQAAVLKTHFKREYLTDYPRLSEWVKKSSRASVPYLYWLGHSWGSWIALNLHNPEALADMVKVQTIMEQVITLDETYYFGSAHLILGSIASSIPPFLGGKPQEGLSHFERCTALNNKNFLLAQFYQAKTYCVMMQNGGLFDSLMQEIEQYDLSLNPDAQLMNSIAKHRAAHLKRQREELFFDEEMPNN
ncbi:hypothetical protein KDK77_08985 [bacterium]|nr:hypothetical protein [bacterium]MCP5462778.1 hypothetical protein [bacterium]